MKPYTLAGLFLTQRLLEALGYTGCRGSNNARNNKNHHRDDDDADDNTDDKGSKNINNH